MDSTTQQTPPGKILFKHTDIRTMRKDIKMLRELDTRKEQSSILAPPKIVPAPKPATTAPLAPRKIIISAPAPTPAPTIQDQAVHQRQAQDQVAIAQAKKYATEEEKQQIFGLESQLEQLKNQLKTIASSQEPALNLEKNQVLLKQEDQKKVFDTLAAEEEKIAAQIQTIGQQEELATVPADKQRLEQQRGTLENRRQELEKQRWVVEQELSALENQLKTLDVSFKQAGNQEGELKKAMAGIDNSLRDIYFGIIDREKTKPVVPKPAATMPAAPVAPPTLREPGIQPAAPKKYLEDVPVAVKEQITQAAPLENNRRRKFMEDVEAWAQSADNKEVNP